MIYISENHFVNILTTEFKELILYFNSLQHPFRLLLLNTLSGKIVPGF
jgi:hypothetical protein